MERRDFAGDAQGCLCKSLYVCLGVSHLTPTLGVLLKLLSTIQQLSGSTASIQQFQQSTTRFRPILNLHMSRYEGRMRIGETVFEDTGTGKVYQSLPPRDQDLGAVEWKDSQPAPSWYTDQTASPKPAELYRGLLDVRSTPKSILKM